MNKRCSRLRVRPGTHPPETWTGDSEHAPGTGASTRCAPAAHVATTPLATNLFATICPPPRRLLATVGSARNRLARYGSVTVCSPRLAHHGRVCSPRYGLLAMVLLAMVLLTARHSPALHGRLKQLQLLLHLLLCIGAWACCI
jgi:hypothetical protein